MTTTTARRVHIIETDFRADGNGARIVVLYCPAAEGHVFGIDGDNCPNCDR